MWTSSPIASVPDSGSAPMTLRTRKSPRANSGLCSSTTTPTCRPWRIRSRSSGGAAGAHAQPAANPFAVLGRRGRGALLQARQRGFARELRDAVALATRDDIGTTERTTTLRHHRADVDTVDDDPDCAAFADCVVEEEPVAARHVR